MSTVNRRDEEDIPTVLREIAAHNYLHLVGISILFYDHLLTAGREIKFIWRRPKINSSYYFFFNRYCVFFGNIAVTVLGFSNLSAESCGHYNVFRQLLLFVNEIFITILLTMRIYALYGCSRTLLKWLSGTAFVLLIFAFWALFSEKGSPAQSAPGCHIGTSRTTAIHLAGSWEAVFVYDTIVFGLTIYKTWKYKQDYSITGVEAPLLSIILKDGILYFAVIAFCNLCNILTFYVLGPFLRGSLSTFASGLSATMMARLMLNLHEAGNSGILNVDDTIYHAPTSYITFDSIELSTVITDEESVRWTRSESSPQP